MGLFSGFDDLLDVVKSVRSLNSVDDLFGIGVDYAFRNFGDRERFVGDTKRTMSGEFQPRRIIYGERLVSGNLVNISTPLSLTNDDLFLYFVLAAQRSEQVVNLYADGELAATSEYDPVYDRYLFVLEPGWIEDVGGSSPDIYYLSGQQLLGNSGRTISMRRPGNEGGGLHNGCFNGQTVVSLHLRFNIERYKSGVPEFTFLVKGKHVYDPRNTTTAYSNNYALCVLDWMRSQMAIPDSEIDMDSFSDAADICDESVTIPEYLGVSTESRYRVNGVLELNKTPLENLQRLMSAGNAWLSYAQGKWRIHMPAYSAPIMTLTDADLIGGIRFSPATGKQKRLNTIRASYIDPSQNWERVESPLIKVAEYITNDKETLEGSVDFEMVTSPYQAQRLCKQVLEASRYGIFVIANFKFIALQVTVGDRVALTIPDLTWTAKVFRVYDVEMDIDRGVTLTLREDAEEIYDWDIGDALEVVAPDPILLPDVTSVGVPISLSATEMIYGGSMASDLRTRVTVTWQPPEYQPDVDGTPELGDYVDQRTFRYDVEFKLSADSEWSQLVQQYFGTSAVINDVVPGTYDFRVRAVNVAGFSSEWLSITNHGVLGLNGLSDEQLAVIAPFDLISGLSLQNELGGIFKGRDAVFEWSHSNAPLHYFRHYQIEMYSGAQLLRTEQSATPSYNYAYEKNALDYQRINGVPGIYWALEIRVKPVSIILNSSNNLYAGIAATFEAAALVVDAPEVSLSYVGPNAVLTWAGYADQFLTITTTLEYSGNVIQETTGNSFIVPVNWTGSRTFSVRAAHLPTHSSTVVEVIINPSAPALPVVTTQVIANSVLLNYRSTAGSLPIERFEIRRGGTYDSGQTPDIKSGSSSFTIYNESVAATIVFWFEAVDTAGNHSGHLSVSAQVTSPPNYQLLATYSAKTANWPGTKTNALVTETNSLLVPVNTTETFQQHFDNNTWSTPQDQVTAGFEYYIQPSTNTAQYVVTYDYGSSIDSAIISATTAPVVFDGSVTAQVTIAWSPNNSSWTSATAGQTQALATTFRYARVTIDITASGGDDLAYIEDVLIKLDKQVDEDFGPLTATSSDTNGTFISFNKDFIDANTPTVTINAGSISGSTESTPIRAEAIIRFVDEPDPTGFYIYVYNAANGNRVTATGSWHVYGFTRT